MARAAVLADAVQVEIVVGEREAMGLGDGTLTLLDDGIDELDDLVALEADQVIVVVTLIHLENRVAAFEMMTGHEAGGLELGQYAIDRGQAHVLALIQQGLVDIFRAQMMSRGTFQDLQDLNAREGDLQPGFFQLQVFQASILRYDGRRDADLEASQDVHLSGRPSSMQRSLILPALAVALNLSACSAVDWLVYKVPIQQGNLVEQKQVDQLRVGMSKSQVNFILGTPLVVDTFNPDRWDYVYRVAIGGEITKEQRFSVFFRDDKLSAMSGNLKPSAATAALELAPSQN